MANFYVLFKLINGITSPTNDWYMQQFPDKENKHFRHSNGLISNVECRKCKSDEAPFFTRSSPHPPDSRWRLSTLSIRC